jgi:hypothetical protein
MLLNGAAQIEETATQQPVKCVDQSYPIIAYSSEWCV